MTEFGWIFPVSSESVLGRYSSSSLELPSPASSAGEDSTPSRRGHHLHTVELDMVILLHIVQVK